MKNQYHPNFRDPRIIKRCRRALGFVAGVMSTTKSHAWSSRYIDKFLGKSNNPLSNYLRSQLLIVTDEFYRYNSKDAKCKEYRANEKGIQRLVECLENNYTITYPSVLQVAEEEHIAELESGNFEYKDKSNRLWHPLQRYRREYKQQILTDHGYIYQYDIECSAPTLIYQYSKSIPEIIENGEWRQGPMDLHLPNLKRYLEEKELVRQELSNDIALPIQAIKEIINALFAGAVISKHQESDIYKMLDGDIKRIQLLKNNEFLLGLRLDIKTCWQYIRPVMQKRTKTQANGRERLLPLTSKQKWNVYFEQERRVLDQVKDYLDIEKNRYFLEHDGWSCQDEVDIEKLRHHVLLTTGFDIKIEVKKTTIL